MNGRNIRDALARLSQSYALQVVLLASAYAAAAVSGNLLSLPPAAAVPFWPPAGVALAGLLVGGLRLWPGVLLGHLLFAVLGGNYSGTVPEILVAALPYSPGPLLQAVVGAWFAGRRKKGLAPGRDRTVLNAVLLAGPVACLIGASWSTAMFFLDGLVDSSGALSHWLLWWVGDSLGVVLFAPLVVLLLPAGRRFWPNRTWQVALPLLGACAILVPSVYWFHNNEESEARKPVSVEADLALDLALQRIGAASNAVAATANLFSTQREVTAEEFADFSARATTNGIVALGWIPRVPGASRDAFEAAVRQSGAADFRILHSDANGGYVPAPARAEYFPLLFEHSIRDDMRPLGYDFAESPPRARIMERARDTGQPAADEPVSLVGQRNPYIIVLFPVYEHGKDPAMLSVPERREALTGYVGSVIDYLVVLAPLTGAGENAELSFSMSDVTPGTSAGILHNPLAGAGQSGSRTLWTRDIDFHGRTWQVQAHLGDQYWEAGTSTRSRIFLLLALMGAFLITVQTLATAARNQLVSLRVATRTRELKENRRALRGALNLAKIASWTLDLRTGMLTLDDRAFAILGTSAKAEGGYTGNAQKWIDSFVHPDDRDSIHSAAMLRHVADELPTEFRVITRDDQIRHLQTYFNADTAEDGTISVVYGSTQDVTAAKNADLALRESEAYSRSILASSSDCIMVLGLDGRLLDINQHGRESLYVDDIASIRGSDWRNLWKLDTDYNAACTALDQAIASGSSRFTGSTTTAPGVTRWWDVVITPINALDGTPQNLLCVWRDITDEYTAKEEIRRINESLGEEVRRRSSALSASERELRAIFEVAAIGIAHISLDNRVLRVNPKMCEITGYAEDELLLQPDFERTHIDDRQLEQQQVDKLVNGEIDTYAVEKRYVRKDGTTIWIRVTGSLVRDDDDQPLYRVAITEDISTMRAERELRTASERRYRELFERNPTPMWTYDSDTLAFISVNDAAVLHYGFSREEFLKMTLRDLRSSDMQAELDELLQQRLAGFTPAHTTNHRRKDGSIITVEITAHGILNEGRPARLVLANDVTEKVLATTLLEGQKAILEQIAFGAALEDSLASLARLAEVSSRGVRCMVLLADEKSSALRCVAVRGLSQEFVAAVNAASSNGSGFFHDLAHCKDAVVASDIANDPRWTALAAQAAAQSLHSCWSSPILDAGGKVLGAFVLFYQDARKPQLLESDLVETLTNTAAIAITKDRETRRLRDSEEKFRSTFETAALGMLHVDTRGRFTRANPSVCKIIGYSEEELIGMNAETLAHPDDLELGQDERRRMFAGEIPSYAIEKRYIRKDGSLVWLNVTISTVRGKSGEIEYAVALLEDISWRKQAESELHRQQELNRLLLENLSEGVVACDADGQLMLFNKAAREWHGTDPRMIPPQKWSDYYGLCEVDGVTPLDVAQIPLMRAFNGEHVKAVEMSIVRKGHAPRIVLASGAPLLDADGTKRGAVVVMHDVTARRQSLQKLERSAEQLRAANAAVENERSSLARRVAERTLELTAANAQLATAKEAAEQASKAKSAFLAVMSHEIRTPMNGILGMVDVLAQSRLADDQQDAIMTIRESSFSLLRLIDDILDFSKVEAGRLDLEKTTVSIAEIVEGVRDSLATAAHSSEVDLKLFIGPGVPDRVLADPTRLRQLLFNLIGNAVKFSGGRSDRRGNVQVFVERQASAPESVVFRIVDNGVGIAPEALPRLFDSFTQAEVSTTRRFGGTGLGLAITKRLIELMHGTIEVSSSLGQGSEFVVRLPFEEVQGAAAAPEFDLGDVQCLIVDSHGGNGEALMTYLAEAGVRARSAPDADTAGTLADASEELSIIVELLGERAPADASLLASGKGLRNQVKLFIAPGPRAHARIVGPQVVLLQTNAIRRRDFLRAVAVAAGRASPEVADRPAANLVRGQLLAPTVAQARTDGRLILVAEDDAINQKVILRQLALLGYAGEMASDGKEALRMWRDGSYALLLTDLHMPAVDGYELVQTIRAEESADNRLPVIALTANALRGEAERAASVGFDAYLTKPLQLSVLGATLAEWIPSVRSEDQAGYMQAAGAASSSSPAIDLKVLRSIIGDDELMLREFLSDYLASSANQVAELRDVITDSDSRRISKHAHRQKGAARAIGANKLGDLCAELENAARADDRGLILEVVAQYELRVAEVHAEIHAILAQHEEQETVDGSALNEKKSNVS